MKIAALMPWLDRPDVRPLVAALGADTLRFVGGAVRDHFLNMPVTDIDIATSLTPDIVMARAHAAGLKTIPTGLAHGTVTVLSGPSSFEVTTLRRDVATDGRHATVAFTTDWAADALRRDFTLNALYADCAGWVYDYVGGWPDLHARRVRFIGDADARIQEDALRILRFFRFSALCGDGLVDAAGLAACRHRAAALMTLSRERIQAELFKMLSIDQPVAVVRSMIAADIFRPIVPEIETATRLEALCAVDQMDKAPVRRLAALLPATPEVLESVAIRLKLSVPDRKRLVLCAGPAPHSAHEVRVALYRWGRQTTRDRLLLTGAPLAPEMAVLLETWPIPSRPISGKDMIARGIPPGPQVSACLAAFEAAWIAADFPTDAHSLERLIDACCPV